jgi:hypothetical protein
MIALATPASAQPHAVPAPGAVSSEVQLQLFSFGNFFYSSDPRGKQDVTAIGAEYRAGWRFSQSPAELFVHVNSLGYQHSGLDRAYGGRVGVWSEGKRQQYRVFVDLARNRPASDIRNAGTANRNMLFGEYGYNVAPAWQLVARGTHEHQEIRNQAQRDNTMNGVEGIVRYRGFGWQVTPHMGVVASRRNVNDRSESYRDRGAVIGVEYIPITPVWLSIAFRDVQRGFDSDVAHGGHERHDLVELIGDWHAMRRLRLTLYYQREHVASPLNGQSFNAHVLIASTTWAF